MAQPTTEQLRDAILRHTNHSLVRLDWNAATPRERFVAVALAVRDRLIDVAIETEKRYREAGARRTFYLSMEFLMGRALRNNLENLGLVEECASALRDLDTELGDLLEEEEDAALGNGGLGRLAACFLDSLATLGMPGYGYGINYEYGLFRQEIRDGRQVEKPDRWLTHGTPWEVARSEDEHVIPLYGRVEHTQDSSGELRARWVDTRTVLGVPHDMPIAGYGGRTVNILRLFTARASKVFDMEVFNAGDYLEAVRQKVHSETVSKVLYPSDEPAIGAELRLIQEYFLVGCALRDIFRNIARGDVRKFESLAAIQLNDTHPALAVAELMRMLVDEHEMAWTEAWAITTKTLTYTNHTLLPEALERWPVSLLGRVLPRHLEIIREVDRRFLETVASTWPGDDERRRRMSIIEESDDPQVRMAHLAIVGSHAVNGVAAVHSNLVKTRLVPDFHELWPEKFSNKTNGVTPRRWLLCANPDLSRLVTEAIGDGWVTDLDELRGLEPFADDAAFRERFLDVKRRNKERVAEAVRASDGDPIDVDSLFDVQMKRFHEYKRQLLDVLHIVHAYLEIVEHERTPKVPRTFVFSGKAAPSYVRAKQTIELIHAVGAVIDGDPRARDHLRVVFVPNYGVSVAELVIPATDLSEQISTAGFEASGTGNMKFAMNGAMTIGTLDGANIEIAEEVGAHNIFIFGKTVEEIEALRSEGRNPREFYEGSERIRAILDTFRTDRFGGGAGRFGWVHSALVESWDPYFHLADLESYLDTQARVDQLRGDPESWAQKAILNVARMGKFSSDRTIREYARDIWRIEPVL